MVLRRVVNRQTLFGELAFQETCLHLKASAHGRREAGRGVHLLQFADALVAAVDLVESGYTIEQVMRKGDWKSVQAGLRYVMAE